MLNLTKNTQSAILWEQKQLDPLRTKMFHDGDGNKGAGLAGHPRMEEREPVEDQSPEHQLRLRMIEHPKCMIYTLFGHLTFQESDPPLHKRTIVKQLYDRLHRTFFSSRLQYSNGFPFRVDDMDFSPSNSFDPLRPLTVSSNFETVFAPNNANSMHHLVLSCVRRLVDWQQVIEPNAIPTVVFANIRDCLCPTVASFNGNELEDGQGCRLVSRHTWIGNPDTEPELETIEDHCSLHLILDYCDRDGANKI